MSNIVFQTVDGTIYGGELIYLGKEELSVKNLYKFSEFYETNAKKIIDFPCKGGDVWFYTNSIIWYKKTS
ncbi:hypothetical protein FDB55_01095 [Clostridium botulinum]|uniref:Uncharacterized protein n=1 Tax=Clostridium botulinum TaxID=1491 RepID=A0A0C2SNT0_CLOBO|nr:MULTISPECIES: hypothetical protein [Clostridium]ACD51518.1 hypothetical protein CLH_1285 [Clostridium botulinum E3 str. Alaska E43]AJF29294.1 hypothetical protein ST13_06195 [Clostridium botulinum]AJF32355.1 hypothetical protein ST12_06195 [Clostridium botulinum]EES50818.1 hypothetical protein CLO_2428 [Clostridium botulinum E1 str. 'BoNT E Beluga']KAI3351025.1 hypothetical protein CIT18_00875 [Clostridium botulinum]